MVVTAICCAHRSNACMQLQHVQQRGDLEAGAAWTAAHRHGQPLSSSLGACDDGRAQLPVWDGGAREGEPSCCALGCPERRWKMLQAGDSEHVGGDDRLAARPDRPRTDAAASLGLSLQHLEWQSS